MGARQSAVENVNSANIFNVNPHKELTNLSIDTDLLVKANELTSNLSAALEQKLAEILKAKKEQQWC